MTNVQIGFDFAVRTNPFPAGRMGGGLIRAVRFSLQQAVPDPWNQTDHRAKAVANQARAKARQREIPSNEF